MTKGSDNRTIDGMSLKRIDNLIASLKSERYHPARIAAIVTFRYRHE